MFSRLRYTTGGGVGRSYVIYFHSRPEFWRSTRPKIPRMMSTSTPSTRESHFALLGSAKCIPVVGDLTWDMRRAFSCSWIDQLDRERCVSFREFHFLCPLCP